ncbi:MAG: hypothetical protein Q8R08_03580 [bacterium]|nr:hypothetical protein [bacterium]
MTEIILHIDMNSYFASCEQQANVHLRGRPVGVCEHLGGIIIAPSVEAKRLGIKLGTTVWDARKIYPAIVLLPVDPDKYRHVTAAFLKILYEYSNCVEKYSIDEAFVDLSKICKNYDDALLVGLEIKQRIRKEIGEWVSCSIGIGPNKLISKIAADLGTGDLDRIFVVKPNEIDRLYQRLKLTDIPGIGPRLERAFNKLGIFSLQQLRDYPVANLINQFGINGYFLHQLSRFHNAPFTPSYLKRGEGELSEQIKSFGHSYTLPKPINKFPDIKKLMYKLCEKIGRRMRRQGARGNVIHYFHSTPSFNPPPQEGEVGWGSGFSKQHKIQEFIDDGREIYKAAFNIFEGSRPGSNSIQIKIMGISVSGLMFDNPPEPLFEQYKKPAWLVEAMDQVNNKYGEFTICRGRLLGIPSEWGKDTVGFGRMKEF